MKIELYQQGGIIGERVKLKEIRDNEPGSEHIKDIALQMQKAGFFDPEQYQAGDDMIGADLLTYEIIFEDDAGKRSAVQLTRPGKNTLPDQLLNALLTI